MHVTSLTIENVRWFKKESIPLKPGFNLLVGINGAGKSTFLRSLYSVLSKPKKGVRFQVLGDEDIKSDAAYLSVSATIANGAGKQLDKPAIYLRRRGKQAKRPGFRFEPLVLWYGPTEATCNSLVNRTVRKVSQVKMNQMAELERWIRKQTVLHIVEIKNPDRFGRSEEINDFVREILKRFSPKYIDFGWIFEPYGCSIRPPAGKSYEFDSIRDIRRKAETAILNCLQNLEENQLHRIDRESVRINSRGYLIGSNLDKPAMPPFSEILGRAGIEMKRAGILDEFEVEIRLTPRIQVMTTSGFPLLLRQLSDGEQRLFSIFVDIARCLAVQSTAGIFNKQTTAIIIVDEIDLHLHPKWQREIVPALEDFFPACQFVVTTHSPFIVQATPEEKVQQIGGEMVHGFQDRGIEEITVKVMGIEDHQVSTRYLALLDAAREYFQEINNAKKLLKKGVADERSEFNLAAIKKRMTVLSQRFDRDPAQQAFLGLHRDLALDEEDFS